MPEISSALIDFYDLLYGAVVHAPTAANDGSIPEQDRRRASSRSTQAEVCFAHTFLCFEESVHVEDGAEKRVRTTDLVNRSKYRKLSLSIGQRRDFFKCISLLFCDGVTL